MERGGFMEGNWMCLLKLCCAIDVALVRPKGKNQEVLPVGVRVGERQGYI